MSTLRPASWTYTEEFVTEPEVIETARRRGLEFGDASPVGTGAGAILLPLPLARHLAGKRTHAVIPVYDEKPLMGTQIWATWSVERDAGDVQQLVGIMRGRTARSQRPGANTGDPQAKAPSAGSKTKKPAAKKPQLPKNSRGAQLAAATEKREAAKRARAQLKRRGR